MIDELIMKLAGRGYCWYLALKIGKAASAPVFVAGWVVYAVAGFLFVWLAGCVQSAYETARIVVSDFHSNVLRRKWLTGFSRDYYQSLDHYKPAPTAYKPEDMA